MTLETAPAADCDGRPPVRPVGVPVAFDDARAGRGASRQARFRQGSAMVDEIERFLKGEPLHYPVTQDMLAIMA